MQLVFIHGLGQTPSSWEKTIEHMTIDVNCVCPDLPRMLHNQTIHYTNLYGAFSEYCNGFSEPVNLCGLSLGGILALHYGIEHPSKVNSLVLIGTQHVIPKKLLAFQNILFRFMPESMFQEMGFGKKDFIQLSKSMMALDFTHDLSNLSCPVLVICGEKDHANKKASKELAKQVPNGKLQIIWKAGHEINTEAPAYLAEILNQFFLSTRS